jgi:flagellar motor switch protein FliG
MMPLTEQAQAKPSSADHHAESNSAQLAAALMILLGEEASALILKELEDEEVRLLTGQMLRLNYVSSRMAQSAVKRFSSIIESAGFAIPGGPRFARQALTAAFGENSAALHMGQIEGPQAPGESADADAELDAHRQSRCFCPEWSQSRRRGC